MNLTKSVSAVEVPPVVAGVIKVLPKKDRTAILKWYLMDFSAYCQRNWNHANTNCEMARLHYETLSRGVGQEWVNWTVAEIKKEGFSGYPLPLLDTEEPLAIALRELLGAELAYSLYKKHLKTQRKFFWLCNELVPAHETGLQKWEVRDEMKAWIKESPCIGNLEWKLKNSKVTVSDLLNFIWSASTRQGANHVD